MPSFDLYTVTGGMSPDEIGGALNISNVKPEQSVILFGDSFTYYQNDDSHGGGVTAASMWSYLIPMLGSAVQVVGNAGVGGNTAEMMQARLDTDVLSIESDWVFMQVGVNDFYGFGYTAEKVFAEVSAISDQIIQSGRKLLLVNCFPQNSARSGFSKEKSLESVRYNKMINDYSSDKTGMFVIDVYSEFVDWTDTVYAASKQEYLAGDGIHLSPFGALEFAKIAFRQIRHMFNSINKVGALSPIDSDTSIGNPFLSGLGGSVGASAIGVVPDGHVLTVASGTGATITGARVGDFYEIDVVLNSASNARVRLNSSNLASLVSSGEKCSLVTTFSLYADPSVSVRESRLSLYMYDGVTLITDDWGRVWNLFSDSVGFDTGVITVKTNGCDIPENVQSFQSYFDCTFSGTGSAKIRIREMNILLSI